MFINKSRGIKRDKANKEINASREIEQVASTIMQAAFALTGNKAGKEYYKEAFNAFIFSPASALKYFYGPNIPPIPSGGAEYLAVITGAHDVDETVDETIFTKGQRTAMLCGLVQKKDTNGDPVVDPDNNTIFQIVDPSFVKGVQPGSVSDPDVADQFPPHDTWVGIPLTEGPVEIVVKK
jgi:hypothetical protein